MKQERLPDWESQMIDDMIEAAERRRQNERIAAKKRAVQLAREQGYHRLAVEIDRPTSSKVSPDQLTLFPTDPTLFDDVS